MKFSIEQENLHLRLGIVAGGIASRSTLPVLSNVKLETKDDRLIVSSTNLEVAIVTQTLCGVEYEGAITIPHRLFSDWVNAVEGRLTFELNEETQTLNAKGHKVQANFKGIEAGDFPYILTDFEDADVYELDTEILGQVIRQTVISAKPRVLEKGDQVLNHVCFVFSDDGLKVTAADGFRMSRSSASCFQAEPVEMLIPLNVVKEIGRVFSCGVVKVKPQRSDVAFMNEDTMITTKMFGARFPDIERITPKEWSTRTVVKTKELLQAVKVAHLFAKENAGVIRLTIESDRLCLGAGQGSEMGMGAGDIEAVTEGNGLKIAFSSKYLLDVLGVIETPEVALEVNKTTDPGVFRPVLSKVEGPVEGNDFSYIVMPMHIKE